MLAIFLALAPLFSILMGGVLLRKTQFVADSFWRQLEKLTFWALLPSLFLKTMAEADFSSVSLYPLLTSGLLLLTVMMAWLMLSRPLLQKVNGPSYSSIIQGATRFNNYVGLPVVLSLHGQSGVVIYAVIMSVMIPATNITSVWAISHYASHEPIRWKTLLKLVITNPLIVATSLGIFLNLTGIGLPPVIHEVVTAFANASLVMGVLAIGASLDIGAVRADRKPVLYSCLLKLIVFPLIALGAGSWVRLDNLSLSVLILFAGLPTATSSFILASQMGGNATLMANITASETLFAFITLPCWLAFALHYFPV